MTNSAGYKISSAATLTVTSGSNPSSIEDPSQPLAAGSSSVQVRVYPNPLRSARGDNAITFDRMPAGSTVKLFTVSGRHVKTLPAPTGSVNWDLTTDSGDKAASGLYLYLITDNQGNQTRGKLTIIR